MTADDKLIIRPLTDADRGAIATWRYGGALAIYDPGAAAFALRSPDHFAIADADLVGYGTLGAQAQVPGGHYPPDPAIVDVGLGLRPDLVGSGRGASALLALLAHVHAEAPDRTFRATVATANGRATALVVGLGFGPTHRFVRTRDGREFTQFSKPPPR